MSGAPTETALADHGEVPTYAAELMAAGYELTLSWSTGSPDTRVAVETWGRRADRVAVIYLFRDAPLEAGSVTAGGTDGAFVTWNERCRDRFGIAWLRNQGADIRQGLATRWGTT